MLARMRSVLVESYLAKQPAALAEAIARARRAAELGDRVAYLRSTYVPADETCLHLFEAPSAAALGEAARLADLSHLRIVETIETAAQARLGAPA
jgi:uncharacterized protein YchJ